jgi:hypothetical protein
MEKVSSGRGGPMDGIVFPVPGSAYPIEIGSGGKSCKRKEEENNNTTKTAEG